MLKNPCLPSRRVSLDNDPNRNILGNTININTEGNIINVHFAANAPNNFQTLNNENDDDVLDLDDNFQSLRSNEIIDENNDVLDLDDGSDAASSLPGREHSGSHPSNGENVHELEVDDGSSSTSMNCNNAKRISTATQSSVPKNNRRSDMINSSTRSSVRNRKRIDATTRSSISPLASINMNFQMPVAKNTRNRISRSKR